MIFLSVCLSRKLSNSANACVLAFAGFHPANQLLFVSNTESSLGLKPPTKGRIMMHQLWLL